MHVACISYGKDSMKMLDVIKTRSLPLDKIVTFDVWATDTILADFPEVSECKQRLDHYIFSKYGITVDHLYAKYPNGEKMTYEKEFYRVFSSGKNEGNIYGFPFQIGPWCNSRLKLGARTGYLHAGDIEYIGIAYDEKARHKIMCETKVAPLVDFRIDEDLCGLHCMYEDILLPTYRTSSRDGCWFCHNQGIEQLRELRKKHPALWGLLLKWDMDSPVPFTPTHTVHDYDKRFYLEDKGLVPIAGRCYISISERGFNMSEFDEGTLQEVIYQECKRFKEKRNAKSVDIIYALSKVLEVYADRAAQGY